MVAKWATVVFFGVWALDFFVGFAFTGIVLAVAAGVAVLALIVGK